MDAEKNGESSQKVVNWTLEGLEGFITNQIFYSAISSDENFYRREFRDGKIKQNRQLSK